MRCVVFGATGYIGGRLVPELLDAGHTVRAVARDPGKLDEVAVAGPTPRSCAATSPTPTSVRAALRRARTSSTTSSTRCTSGTSSTGTASCATTLAHAAHDAGVERIVYLGGIAPDGEELSPHLASRAEVGEILLGSGVPTVVLKRR